MKDKQKDSLNYLIAGLWTIMLFLMLFCVVYIINYNLNPPPTFRQRCEANGGTFVANDGKAGNSCIYYRDNEGE